MWTLIASLTTLLATTKVFWIVVLYTVFGAKLFMWLELSTDLEAKQEAHDYHLVARDSLLFKLAIKYFEILFSKEFNLYIMAQNWKRVNTGSKLAKLI